MSTLPLEDETPAPKGKRDPKNYRACSEPHADLDAANEAMAAFLKGVGELRKQHRIANVVSILHVSALTENGEEGEYIVAHHFGDELRFEALTAYAYAQAKREHEETIARILARKR